ncbi:BrxA family protein [uncultured Sphaerochaeta sp.]|uniref:BrxA family protein n=1 Tax=uncultured Sphaerochaeta sp. TaxID=886478 RepID=UPI002A0A280D|nr:BrxA family protein [uncultured Sphaerochaeta sp.]
MTEQAPYIMLFSFGGLNLRESLIACEAYLKSNDGDQAKRLIIQENLLQSRIISSAKRLKDKNSLSFMQQILLKSNFKKCVVHHGLLKTN